MSAEPPLPITAITSTQSCDLHPYSSSSDRTDQQCLLSASTPGSCRDDISPQATDVIVIEGGIGPEALLQLLSLTPAVRDERGCGAPQCFHYSFPPIADSLMYAGISLEDHLDEPEEPALILPPISPTLSRKHHHGCLLKRVTRYTR